MNPHRTGGNPPSLTKVWDLPIRLGHWLMAAVFAASWWTAENAQMDYHRYSGYTMMGLLLFRLYWGFAGSRTARFTQFIKSPRQTWDYVRAPTNTAAAPAGHNPLGAWSVVALLALLIAMVTLGLYAVDVDGLESGPLSPHVSFETGRAAAHWHHRVFNALLAMVALHIAAVLYYTLVRSRKLIPAMIHGRAVTADGESVESAGWARFVVGAALAAGAVWWIL